MDILAIGLISYFILDKQQTGGASNITINKITQLTKKYIKENKLPDTFILELTGDHRLQNKLNKLYKNLLKRKQIGGAGKNGKDKDLCPICTDPLIDDLMKLPCRHIFHTGCIEEWFERSNRCPLCNQTSGRPLPQAVVNQQEQEQEQELMGLFNQLPQEPRLELVRQYYRHQQMETPAWSQPTNTTRTIARRRTLEREQRERETYYGGLIVFTFLIILYTIIYNQTGDGRGYRGRPKPKRQLNRTFYKQVQKKRKRKMKKQIKFNKAQEKRAALAYEYVNKMVENKKQVTPTISRSGNAVYFIKKARAAAKKGNYVDATLYSLMALTIFMAYSPHADPEIHSVKLNTLSLGPIMSDPNVHLRWHQIKPKKERQLTRREKRALDKTGVNLNKM